MQALDVLHVDRFCSGRLSPTSQGLLCHNLCGKSRKVWCTRGSWRATQSRRCPCSGRHESRRCTRSGRHESRRCPRLGRRLLLRLCPWRWLLRARRRRVSCRCLFVHRLLLLLLLFLRRHRCRRLRLQSKQALIALVVRRPRTESSCWCRLGRPIDEHRRAAGALDFDYPPRAKQIFRRTPAIVGVRGLRGLAQLWRSSASGCRGLRGKRRRQLCDLRCRRLELFPGILYDKKVKLVS